MSVGEKKAEILKLIEKLDVKRITTGGDQTPGAENAIGEKLIRRRQSLIELKRSREKMESDLLEERLLSVCQLLDERIAKIEKLVGPEDEDSIPRIHSVGSKKHGALEKSDSEPGLLDESGPDIPGLIEPKHQPSALGGEIAEGVLADILQLITSNTKTGVFRVGEAKDEEEINLYFRDGNLYHASFLGGTGQSAFFAAMSKRSGRFNFYETNDVSDEKSIEGNTQFLILEALRQIDENSGDQE